MKTFFKDKHELVEELEYKVEVYERGVQNVRDRLAHDDEPLLVQLEWSRSYFETAAHHYVWKKWLDAFKNADDSILDRQLEILQEHVNKNSCYVPNSTSETTVIADLEKNAAEAKLLSYIQTGI